MKKPMSNPVQKFKNLFHSWQSYQANWLYGFPFRKLKILAVTGTDGKTTTTQMIFHILKENGFKVAYLSTINARIGDRELDTGFHVTTPDPWMVPKYLKMMVAAGTEYLVLEATSQGLVQNRLWGMKFEAAAITNIKEDHLDYHGTWENYAAAKYLILKKLKSGGLAAVNADDTKAAGWIRQQLQAAHLDIDTQWYSKNELSKVTQDLEGLHFVYHEQKFVLPLLGRFNLENALAAIKVTHKYLALDRIAKALLTFPTPVGRMQIMQKKPFLVIIDFAHTPHALRAALTTVNEIKPDNSRVITVFGCAGKRDKDRRNMGSVSSEMADITILTAEDPRDETLSDVNSEIFSRAGKEQAILLRRFPDHAAYKLIDLPELTDVLATELKQGKKPFLAFDENNINSRKDAIELALRLAKPKDIVFITGKAHEASLAFGDQEFPWSDLEEVKKHLDQAKNH
jgi:UDP-N-acetylmuramoyl-L-alanyl-D-glutamate--2,6-diaminopimelate ligase